jgi:uncharacterized Zn finger protein
VDAKLETGAPSITEDVMRQWTGARSFELGKRAFRTGALTSTRAAHGVLRARCQGSATLPYRVDVTLSAGGIASAHCTCGRGREGRCKHTAALLYAWVEVPETFTEIEPLGVALERLSPQSLLTLVRRLVRRSDGMADLVEQELPFVTGAVASAEQMNVDALRREVAIALGMQRRPHYDDWAEAGALLATEDAASGARLRPIFELGDDYLARSRYALAITVYRAIAQTTIEAASGDVGAAQPATIRSTLRSCAEGLGQCLSGTTAAGLRRAILHALVEILSADTEALGPEDIVYIEGLLMSGTSDEERAELVALIRGQVQHAAQATTARPSRLDALMSRIESSPAATTPRARG